MSTTTIPMIGTSTRLFNQVLIGVILLCIIKYKCVNKLVDKLLKIKRIDHKKKKNKLLIDYKPLIYILPIIVLMYNDHLSESWTRLVGITNLIPDKTLNYALRILGAYGIVQVLGQDLGIKTGANQRNIIQQPILQLLLLWGGAYSLTGARSEGLMAVLMYFSLKFNVSNGKTSAVCFEDV
jgi:hypothetical protein